jgi:hypothetical protein
MERRCGRLLFRGGLPQAMMTIGDYTNKFNGTLENIQAHTQYLLNTIITQGRSDSIMDIFHFTGLLVFIYFNLDPNPTRGCVPPCFTEMRTGVSNYLQWYRVGFQRSLRVNGIFWDLIRDLFSHPLARYEALQCFGQYYKNDSHLNDLVDLMVYIWSLRKFGADPNYESFGSLWWVSCGLPDCSDDLADWFRLGS